MLFCSNYVPEVRQKLNEKWREWKFGDQLVDIQTTHLC